MHWRTESAVSCENTSLRPRPSLCLCEINHRTHSFSEDASVSRQNRLSALKKSIRPLLHSLDLFGSFLDRAKNARVLLERSTDVRSTAVILIIPHRLPAATERRSLVAGGGPGRDQPFPLRHLDSLRSLDATHWRTEPAPPRNRSLRPRQSQIAKRGRVEKPRGVRRFRARLARSVEDARLWHSRVPWSLDETHNRMGRSDFERMGVSSDGGQRNELLRRRRQGRQGRVRRSNEGLLLLAAPALQLLLSLDGRPWTVVPLEVDQIRDVVLIGERGAPAPVLSTSAPQAVRHTNVEDRPAPVAEDVDVVGRAGRHRTGSVEWSRARVDTQAGEA